MALGAGLARLHARMRMNMPTRPGTHMHARTHARTSLQTHRLIAFLHQQWLRERASVLRCTYIACHFTAS